MRKLAVDAGLADRIAIDSAGTGDWHVGELPDARARAAAHERGLVLDHRARQFTRADFDRFDLVLAMDALNLKHLLRMAGQRESPPVRLLRSFDATAPDGAEVPDPYAGDRDEFELVLDICERACAGLLAHVRASLRA